MDDYKLIKFKVNSVNYYNFSIFHIQIAHKTSDIITKLQNMNNYEIVSLIGQGAYGVVLKAKRKDTGVNVAIKKFKQTDDDQLIKKTTVRQIKVLRSLKHRNIVQLQQAFKKKGLVHLVFQYLDNNLLEILQKNPTGLPNKTIAKYMYQVLQGLQYMHSLHFVHRDIKPQNLLISNQGLLKICDMGFAKSMQDEMTDYVATRWYRPPELLVGASYGPPIDIWAVGCIMAELSDTQPLFPGANQVNQLELILAYFREIPSSLKIHLQRNPTFRNSLSVPSASRQLSFSHYKSKMTDKGVDLLVRMLQLDPQKRITASEALKHSYFDFIRPRKQRFQKTAQGWAYSKNNSKILLPQNFTQRNQRNSEIIDTQKVQSIQKQNSNPKVSNLFFKFGQKKWEVEHNKIEQSNLYETQKGINKIYRKKQNEKNKYLIPYQLYQRKPEKFATMLNITNKTNNNFKISQKKREKSTYLVNV